MPYNLIRGVTYSKLTYEFVVHGNDDEYDYNYISPDRNLIICLLFSFLINFVFKYISQSQRDIHYFFLNIKHFFFTFKLLSQLAFIFLCEMS